jgi:hypothetical protein
MVALEPIDEQAILLGFARSSAPVDSTVLAQLAMRGQKQRFERPVPAAEANRQIELGGDHRPILPDAARRLFVRLFADPPKSQNDRLEEAAVVALDRENLRLHPFDFAVLEPLVLRHRDALGPAAASWVAIVRPRGGSSEDDEIEVLAGLRQLRGANPNAARAEIQTSFTDQPAARRAAMLDVLRVALGPSDVAFLASLESDKAGSVRDRATELLGRIPGTADYGARLARARDHVKVQTSGLVFKKKSLSVQGITEKSGSMAQLLDGLMLHDLAAQFDLDVPKFVELASETDGLAEPVLLAVLAQGQFDLMPYFVASLRPDGADLISLLPRLLPQATSSVREKLLRALVGPKRWDRLPPSTFLDQLWDAWGGPLPIWLANDLVGSEAWLNHLSTQSSAVEPVKDERVEAVAALLPRELSLQFVAAVEPLSRRAADYHRFLLALVEEAT